MAESNASGIEQAVGRAHRTPPRTPHTPPHTTPTPPPHYPPCPHLPHPASGMMVGLIPVVPGRVGGAVKAGRAATGGLTPRNGMPGRLVWLPGENHTTIDDEEPAAGVELM